MMSVYYLNIFFIAYIDYPLKNFLAVWYYVQIISLSSLKLFTIPKDLLPLEARENTLKKVSEVLSRFAEKGVPLLDPEEDMKV